MDAFAAFQIPQLAQADMFCFLQTTAVYGCVQNNRAEIFAGIGGRG